MTFDEFSSKYRDLIAAPLSFSPPSVDLDKLLAWAHSNTDNEYNQAVYYGYQGTRDEFESSRDSTVSLWDSYFLLSGKPGSASTWYNDFDKEFPQIAEFVKSMPILGEPMFGFILQKPMSENSELNPHHICRIHTDERNSFGLRLYLNSSKNRMMFYGCKDGLDIEQLISNGGRNRDLFHKCDADGNLEYQDGVPLASDSFFDKPEPTRFKTRDTVFIFNNIKAAHYVHHENDDKVTFLIMGRRGVEVRYDWAKIDASIQESLLTRADEFLYYDDLRN
jgi:hypothetical protein